MFDFKVPDGLKNKKVKTKIKEEIEFQEIFLDALSQKKERLAEKKIEVPLTKRVLAGFSTLFLLSLAFLWLKTGQLQILRKEEFSALAQKNSYRVYFQRPTRGVIYDKNFRQLVFNDSSFDFVCNLGDLPREDEEKNKIIDLAAGMVGISSEELKEKIKQEKSDHLLVLENLEHETLLILESKIKNLPGFAVEENIKRSYDSGTLFSHFLGYLGRIEEPELKTLNGYSSLDYIGKTGLEKSYEDVLRGQRGETMVERDVFFQEISRQKVSEAKPGKSLVLWIDSGLQQKATQALQESLKRVGAKSGAVIAMDPKTGGILSLVSLPSFDNNLFFQKLSQEEWQKIYDNPLNPFWNRCISAAYPSGSTIKPLIASAALEEKIISPRQQIYCEGKIEVPNPWFKDQPWIFRDWTTHGWIDMRQAIAESCNVYFYTLGGGYGGIKGLGEERIKKYLNLFNWGELTGIDIPGERKGLIPDKEWKKQHFQNASEKVWLPGDTYNLSIGQGYLSVTPLQVVDAFSAIANGGKLLRPKLVKEIVDENKNVVRELEPEIIRENFIDEANLKVVREGMREAVLYGSSVILNSLPIETAAKTGTAQTSKPGYYHNWVTVFAPYDDPKIVLTVLIENVPEEQVAVLPVAKEILNWYFSGPLAGESH